MSSYYAKATGNASEIAWLLDAAGGDIDWATANAVGNDLYANSYTVTIDTDVNLGSGTITTNTGVGAAGGGFVASPSSNMSIIANIAAGTTTCLTISHATASVILTIQGNITGGSGTTIYGCLRTSGGGLRIGSLASPVTISGGSGQYSYGFNFGTTGGSAIFYCTAIGGSNSYAHAIVNQSCILSIYGTAKSGNNVITIGVYAVVANKTYLYGNIDFNGLGIPMNGYVIWIPDVSNYIQVKKDTNGNL